MPFGAAMKFIGKIRPRRQCAKVEKFGGVPYPPEVTNFTPSLPLDRRGQGYQSTEFENCCVASMWYSVEVVTGSCVALKPSTQPEADRSRPPRPLMIPLLRNPAKAFGKP
jgi:hypothetical protein